MNKQDNQYKYISLEAGLHSLVRVCARKKDDDLIDSDHVCEFNKIIRDLNKHYNTKFFNEQRIKREGLVKNDIFKRRVDKCWRILYYLKEEKNKSNEKWNTDHMPAGYPKECDTDLLKDVIQDLNHEYVSKKRNGKINRIWEEIILQLIKSGNEELQQRQRAKVEPEKSINRICELIWKILVGLGIVVALIWALVQIYDRFS